MGIAVLIRHARRRPFVLAICLSLLAFGAGAGTVPNPGLAADALPECRYDDLLTRYSAKKHWRITLLDSIYRVPRSYVPPRLVSTSRAGLNAGGRVRRLLLRDLSQLATGARLAGAPLRVVSAYRSYDLQAYLFRREVRNKGRQRALISVARPGHSEHQLGTAIDFGSANTSKKAWSYSDWAQTPAGAWLKKNGWRFGFVMSYPKRHRSVTCYMYEPWHWRYVGPEMAAKVRASGLTLREYQWFNFH